MNGPYYKPNNLTAIYNGKDDSKLTVGVSYKVFKICVLRSDTWFYLEAFPEELRTDVFNFTFYEDGKEIDVVHEIRFWEPKLRDIRLRQDRSLCSFTECQMLAEQYLKCPPGIFAQREKEIQGQIVDGNSSSMTLRALTYEFILKYLSKKTSSDSIHSLIGDLNELSKDTFGYNHALSICSKFAEEHDDELDEETKAVLNLPKRLTQLYSERRSFWEDVWGWDFAMSQNTVDAFKDYLQRFPEGRYRKEAQSKISRKQFTKPVIVISILVLIAIVLSFL